MNLYDTCATVRDSPFITKTVEKLFLHLSPWMYAVKTNEQTAAFNELDLICFLVSIDVDLWHFPPKSYCFSHISLLLLSPFYFLSIIVRICNYWIYYFSFHISSILFQLLSVCVPIQCRLKIMLLYSPYSFVVLFMLYITSSLFRCRSTDITIVFDFPLKSSCIMCIFYGCFFDQSQSTVIAVIYNSSSYFTMTTL